MQYPSSLNLHEGTLPISDQWVLIVENDPDTALFLSQVMQQAGYTARIVRDGVSAIRTFSQVQPNAVILNLDLPDMDGIEFCRYVRRDGLHNTTPILAIRSGTSAHHAGEATRAGADVVMDTPLNAKNLRDATTALVNQQEKSIHAVRTRRLENMGGFDVFPPEIDRQRAVMFVAGQNHDPILLDSRKSFSFGRKPGTGRIGSSTHIDLTPYDAVNCGVSRVHMFLHRLDEKFYIEDVGSSNHTFLNGTVLRPFELKPLKNADEIRLGRLRMYIYLFEDSKPQ
jgi:DNA-binding response OmpR family regulator